MLNHAFYNTEKMNVQISNNNLAVHLHISLCSDSIFQMRNIHLCMFFFMCCIRTKIMTHSLYYIIEAPSCHTAVTLSKYNSLCLKGDYKLHSRRTVIMPSLPSSVNQYYDCATIIIVSWLPPHTVCTV